MATGRQFLLHRDNGRAIARASASDPVLRGIQQFGLHQVGPVVVCACLPRAPDPNNAKQGTGTVAGTRLVCCCDRVRVFWSETTPLSLYVHSLWRSERNTLPSLSPSCSCPRQQKVPPLRNSFRTPLPHLGCLFSQNCWSNPTSRRYVVLEMWNGAMHSRTMRQLAGNEQHTPFYSLLQLFSYKTYPDYLR